MTELLRKQYINRMFEYQNMGLIVCLTGVMYSGKTTILKQAYKIKKDKLPPDNVKFIDFLKKRG
ncbi:MAG: hypothetical protein BZ135_04100 [Methanosphaera sp. rholeuAM6]|nr:MAG: hypothetical protein BZ135_04100 [Methanosphaera sp. rholeuAM6]